MSHTIYAANGKVTHIHRCMCECDYIIDKSLVCLQSERRTSCKNMKSCVVILNMCGWVVVVKLQTYF